MRKIIIIFIITVLSIHTSINAQTKKLPTEINCLITKETVEFRYNSKNQLVYFSEKGTLSYREISLKYDKENRLAECKILRDRGDINMTMKYTYGNDGYVIEDTRKSGKLEEKGTSQSHIKIDNKGRLISTVFDDGKLWEEFSYDDNDNIIKYILHGASGGNDKVTSYSYNDDKSVFSSIENMPLWFWALHLNHLRWCGDFTGMNNPNEATIVDPRYGTETIEITYDYDTEGYPLRQYYDDQLAKEFRYKVIN